MTILLRDGLEFRTTRLAEAVAEDFSMLQMSPTIWQREAFPSGSLQPRG